MLKSSLERHGNQGCEPFRTQQGMRVAGISQSMPVDLTNIAYSSSIFCYNTSIPVSEVRKWNTPSC